MSTLSVDTGRTSGQDLLTCAARLSLTNAERSIGSAAGWNVCSRYAVMHWSSYLAGSPTTCRSAGEDEPKLAEATALISGHPAKVLLQPRLHDSP